MFVFGGKGGIVVATVRKSSKIVKSFFLVTFSLQLGICVMASLINERAQKGEPKENPKTLPPK